MKDINKIDKKQYQLLCSYEDLTQNNLAKNYNIKVETFPYVTFHLCRQHSKSNDKTLVPLGLCGKYFGWSEQYYDIISYEERVNNLAQSWSFKKPTLFLCLIDPECESTKLEEALVFLPAFVVSDEKGYMYEEDEQGYLQAANRVLHQSYIGAYIESWQYNKDLLRYEPERKDKFEKKSIEGMDNFCQRADMICQILNKYDINTASPFAKDILTHVYENTFIMLNKSLKENQRIYHKSRIKKPITIRQKIKDIVSKEDEQLSLADYIQYCQEQQHKMRNDHKQQIEDENNQKEQQIKSDLEKRMENYKL